MPEALRAGARAFPLWRRNLHDILKRRPVTAHKDIHTLTPAAWAKTRPTIAA